MALVTIFATATAAAPGSAVDENADAISARHLARLRSVFREAYASDVELSAIVYSAGHPEHMVALRRSGGSFEVFALTPSQAIWGYGQVEMFRSRLWTMGTLERGGGFRDRSDEEADRLASSLPPNPLDLPLSSCTARLEAEPAETLRRVWGDLFLQLPVEAATGHAGIREVYLARAGSEERETFYYEWAEDDAADRQLIELADSMYRYCRSGQVEGSGLVEILANRRKG